MFWRRRPKPETADKVVAGFWATWEVQRREAEERSRAERRAERWQRVRAAGLLFLAAALVAAACQLSPFPSCGYADVGDSRIFFSSETPQTCINRALLNEGPAVFVALVCAAYAVLRDMLTRWKQGEHPRDQDDAALLALVVPILAGTLWMGSFVVWFLALVLLALANRFAAGV
jgi:hypothetical protein